MLKVIGIVCVMAACILTGYNAARIYAQRPLQLRSLMQGLQYLETEIVFACTPLPLAFKSAGEKITGPVGELLHNVAYFLNDNKNVSPKDAWNEAFRQNRHHLYFKPQVEAILHGFIMGLGQSHRDEQLKQLKLVQELLRAELEKALDESKKFVRMYNALGISAGLTLVILLL